MKTLRMAWRQLLRDVAAGDIRILFAALVLAVVAVTAVGFVTDRAERALAIEANRLLGGDVVIRGDAPITGAIREAANAVGLRRAETLSLDSMIRAGEQLRLGDLRALGGGFPLRGTFRLVDRVGAAEHDAQGIPAPGTLWMSQAGAETLDAKVGDLIGIGDSKLRLAALVVQEPDASLDYFNVAPKAFLNLADLPATGLVQEGSRLGYRLIVAGDAAAVERFTKVARPALARGQRLETIQDARPEIRSALDRAGRFLGLAALVSVVLAAVAVAMAARRHSERHLSGTAVMRCLGASQRTLVGIHVGELVLLGLIACTAGVAVAYGLQWAIGHWLQAEMKISIPPAGWSPALQGYAVGMIVLLAFGAPPVLALRRVPALRVLRRDLDPTEPSAWLVALTGFVGLGALLWWKAGSATLGTAMLLGILATLAVLALLAWLMILLVRRLRSRLRGSLRYGLANVSRRAGTSVAQVSALGLGLMALLLLTFVRTDLLDRWQLSLAADAPNRFIINVQEDQQAEVNAFMAEQKLAPPTLFPMIRGRLVSLNGKPTSGVDYADDQEAGRRAEREFNLSTAATLRDDNKVTAGEFWDKHPITTPELSVEERFAGQLGWKLGDHVAFDIAGRPFEGKITSLRSVDWESFRPNFFVIASPGSMQDYPASYITAVSVPPTQ
ncbi:MAG: FtsX-like permease family protein, partial [Pseudoxanthomonas sp.]